MTPETLEAIRSQTDCTFGELRPDGLHRGACPTHADKVRALDLLAWEDVKRDRRLAKIAQRIRQSAPRQTPAEIGRAIHRYVLDRVRFEREPTEAFIAPWRVLEAGVGDCDDHARLVLALARLAGLSARLETLQRADGTPTHAVAMIHDGDAYRFAETTIAAAWGEHPKAARLRLGASGRGDIGGQLGDVAEGIPDPLSPQGVATAEAAALAAITSDPATAAVLAPIVHLAADVIADAASVVIDAAASAVQGAASGFMTDALSAVSAGAEAAGAAAELIPVVAQAVSWVMEGVALEQARVAAVENNERDRCRSTTTAGLVPKGTGAGGRVMPCDFFVQGTPQYLARPSARAELRVAPRTWLDGGATSFAPPLGSYLWVAGEWILHPYIWPHMGRAAVAPGDLARLTARAHRMTALRFALVDAGLTPGSDGGASIWPVYVDLLRASWDEGAMTPERLYFLVIARQLYRQIGFSPSSAHRGEPENIKLSLAYSAAEAAMSGAHPWAGLDMQQGEHANVEPCVWVDRRGVAAVGAMVDSWRKTIDPRYAADRARMQKLLADLDGSATRIKKEVRRVLGLRLGPKVKLRKLRPSLLRATRKRAPADVRKAIARSGIARRLTATESSAATLLVGAGLLGGAGYLVWRYRRRIWR